MRIEVAPSTRAGTPLRRALAVLAASACVLAPAAACSSSGSGDEQPQCVDVSAQCAPLYQPTYEALFERTFNPTCGQPGSTCHQSGGAGAVHGLIFNTPDHAYGVLLDKSRSWPLVEAGNAGCSKVVYKLTAHDLTVVMPPGRPLSAAEQCAVIQWIQAGAPR